MGSGKGSTKAKKLSEMTPEALPTPPATPRQASPLTKLCKFVYGEVERTEVKNAPYNPRMIDGEARVKLKRSLMKNGLAEPLVWNKRTGNLVGGHQRISLLDQVENTREYRVPCAIVDVDDKQEKALNIALNNPKAQGEFTQEGLEQLLVTDQIDYEAAGYDAADLYQLFGKDVASALTKMAEDSEEAVDRLAKNAKAGDDLEKNMQAMIGRHENIMKAFESENDREFYFYLIFKDNMHRMALAKVLQIDDNKRHFDGRVLVDMLGLTEQYDKALLELQSEPKTEPETTIGTPVANNT